MEATAEKMPAEESRALADGILREAGWTPARMVVAQGGQPLPNNTGAFAFANIVCGHPPEGSSATFAAKELSKIPQAMAEALGLNPADYPDEHHEAAAWLVKAFPAPVDNLLSLGAAEPVIVIEEPPLDVELPESEAPVEAAEAEPDFVGGGDEAAAAEDAGSAEDGSASGGGSLLAHDGSAWEGDSGVEPDHDYEAEFEEVTPDELSDETLASLELEAPDDLGAEILEEHGEQTQQGSGDRFYGLDDIDRRKTVAIGLVMRHAKSLMPHWTTDHDAALRDLRNFAMGVAENRWPDDAGRQLELGALETTSRRIREIERARDEKVEFIEAADREAFDAFIVEADWP